MSEVLIIKLGALGDVVMATPLIRQIQEHHQDDNISLLTSPPFVELFKYWSNINVTAFPRKGWLNSCRLLSWVRSQGFTRLYDLQSNDRSAVICALSGINERAGNHPRYPYNIHPQDSYAGQCHIYERMLDVLHAAGICAEYQLPSLPVSDMQAVRVRNWMEKTGLKPGNFTVMHAGASIHHPQKRWPYFAGLGKALERCGYTVIWVGADDDKAINKDLVRTSGVDATNLFSLPELVALGRQAKFAVTNDSGPMHILSCCGMPVYALFGPTNWRRNHAIGQAQNVLSPDKNSPVFKPADLADLSLPAVIARLEQDGLLC